MIILPAIDIIAGKPVRLYQGDFAKQEVVADSVVETARAFEAAGAEWVHLVDLDGAKEGCAKNATLIQEVANSLSIPVEVGGGIRSMETVEAYLENGVQRVILGTAAVENEAFLRAAIQKYSSRIAVGMDCHDGNVSVRGWLSDSQLEYRAFAKSMEALGVETLIFTDISRDGTLTGPNVEMLKQLRSTVSCSIIASGGIHTIQDIEDLKACGVEGAITGKAMYAGTLDLKEAIQRGKAC